MYKYSHTLNHNIWLKTEQNDPPEHTFSILVWPRLHLTRPHPPHTHTHTHTHFPQSILPILFSIFWSNLRLNAKKDKSNCFISLWKITLNLRDMSLLNIKYTFLLQLKASLIYNKEIQNWNVLTIEATSKVWSRDSLLWVSAMSNF